MARTFVVVTRTEAPVLQGAICKLYGLPRKVNQLSSKAVVGSDPTASGRKDARGWMTRVQSLFRHPSNTGADTDRFATEVTDELMERWQAQKETLFDTAKQAELTPYFDSAAELGTDWQVTDPDTGDTYMDDSEDIVPMLEGVPPAQPVP